MAERTFLVKKRSENGWKTTGSLFRNFRSAVSGKKIYNFLWYLILKLKIVKFMKPNKYCRRYVHTGTEQYPWIRVKTEFLLYPALSQKHFVT